MSTSTSRSPSPAPTSTGPKAPVPAPAQTPPKLTFGDRLTGFFKNAGVSYFAFLYRAWGTADGEPRKILLMKDLRLAVARCWIHLVPVAATVALAYLNIAGFFIGDHLSGSSADDSTNAYFLLLQIAAKLVELLIVASTGKVVLEIVRNELFATEVGLPFGYLVARYQFSDISYFWSPEFLSGWKGLRGPTWKKVFIPLFLLSCGILAVLAGPSAALLLVPTIRSGWPAGGMNFTLLGDEDTLWPTRVDFNHIGGPGCASPSPEMINRNDRNLTGCIWNGYPTLANAYRSYRTATSYVAISMNDGVVSRQLFTDTSDYLSPARPETWSIAPHVAVTRFMAFAAIKWVSAIFHASSTQLPHYSNHNLRYRIRNSSSAIAESLIPAARVKCGTYEDVPFNGSLVRYMFPILPLYEVNREGSYFIPVPYLNSSRISTQWIPNPTSPAQTDTNTYGSDWASAHLAIQIPHRDNASAEPQPGWGNLFTCAVDARWAPGYNTMIVGEPVQRDLTVSLIDKRRAPENITGADQTYFLPNDDERWKTVSLQQDWLNNLTPRMNNQTAGYSTLASILEQMGADNSTGLVQSSWITLQSAVEAVISTLVVDGLSRIGYSNNGVIHPATYDSNQIPWTDYYDSIVAGTTIVPNSYPEGDPMLANGTTNLRWTITVTGLSMKADSWAHYVALVVLLFHACLALAHSLYMILTQLSSDALESLLELLALVASSPPPKPPILENTSGGIRSRKTMRLAARVRCKETDVELSPGGYAKINNTAVTTGRMGRGEQVRLFIGGDLNDYNPANMNLVQVNRKYGSVDPTIQ